MKEELQRIVDDTRKLVEQVQLREESTIPIPREELLEWIRSEDERLNGDVVGRVVNIESRLEE